MKSLWYPAGRGGAVAPGHAAGVTARVAPPRLEVAVTCTGCAGSRCGSATWYWYSPESSKRCSGNEPVAPSAVRHVTVISTSGSSVAVVATSVCRNVRPSLVHQYACRKCSVSAAAASRVARRLSAYRRGGARGGGGSGAGGGGRGRRGGGRARRG